MSSWHSTQVWYSDECHNWLLCLHANHLHHGILNWITFWIWMFIKILNEFLCHCIKSLKFIHMFHNTQFSMFYLIRRCLFIWEIERQRKVPFPVLFFRYLKWLALEGSGSLGLELKPAIPFGRRNPTTWQISLSPGICICLSKRLKSGTATDSKFQALASAFANMLISLVFLTVPSYTVLINK